MTALHRKVTDPAIAVDTPMPDLIKILLVEDQTLMRQGLKTILDLEPGLRVIGEASDGESGVPEVQTLDRTGIKLALKEDNARDKSGGARSSLSLRKINKPE